MASIATARPDYRSLATQVPLGYTQVLISGEYAGTITLVTRVNVDYWSVEVRSVKDAFRAPQAATITAGRIGLGTKVWKNTPLRGDFRKTWVADYWDSAVSYSPIEAGDAHDLRAALGIAIDSAAQRGHAKGLW